MITNIRYQLCEQLLIGDYLKVSSDSLDCPSSWTIVLTQTHIIALFYDYDFNVSPMKSSTLIQAFTVPIDSRPVRNGAGVLRLSHEGVTPGILWSSDLIRNSIVDAISGATTIRLLHRLCKDHSLHLFCTDLTLHTGRHSSTDTILPMIIDRHDIAHVNHVYNDPGDCYVESSDDGHARGFWRFFMPHDAPNRIHPVIRFTIDASQDRCVAVLGQTLRPQWRQIGDLPWGRRILFDGVRGRLYSHLGRGGEASDEAGRIVNIK